MNNNELTLYMNEAISELIRHTAQKHRPQSAARRHSCFMIVTGIARENSKKATVVMKQRAPISPHT
jgi:hypothetical protein